MLHELLLALHGVPGGLFVERKNTLSNNDSILDTVLIPVVENLPFISPAEISLQKELLRLGNYYKKLENFIRQFGSFFCGLYLSSIAFGIDRALSDYRECLTSLESDILVDPDLGLSYISYRLHPYKIMLPVLLKCALKLESAICINESNQFTSSCRLIDIILSSVPNGLSSARLTIRTLLNHVILVFYCQLSSWLIYGILQDPHGEFFIECMNSDTGKPNESSFSSIDVNQHFSFESNNNLRTIFRINDDRVPTFVPPSFAQRVLNSGKAVYFYSTFDESAKMFLYDLERLYLPRFTLLINLAKSNKLMENRTELDLSCDLINTNDLHNLVCDIQGFISHRAWIIMMKDHKLLDYLHLIKDILLLGRGELFLVFFDFLNSIHMTYNHDDLLTHKVFSSQHILDQPVPPDNSDKFCALEYDLNEAFYGSIRSIGIDDTNIERLFKISLLKVGANECTSKIIESHQKVTIGDCLNFEFVSPPALESMFSVQICQAYTRLFRFLFNIRRTQLMLQQFWANQTFMWRQTHACKATTSAYNIDKRLFVCNHMSFVIENLQYYLQVDVIDSQFAHLLDRIKQDQQVEMIQAAHESCLAGLQAQAMMFYPNIELCITNLLRVSREFVAAACTSQYNDSMNEHYPGLSKTEESLFEEFQMHVATLFQILNSSCSIGASSYVSFKSTPNWKNSLLPSNSDMSQLLLRLDFNCFYSQSKAILRS